MKAPSPKTTTPSQRFGAHMSIAGGLHNAFDIGVAAGCDCLQIFVKNQRQWNAKPLDDGAIRAFREAWRRTQLTPVVAHASYLINLGSPGGEIRAKSIRALIDELQRCEALGLLGLVLHPGAHMGDGDDEGIRRIVAALDEAHHATSGFKTRTILENTAGQGSAIGHRAEHLGRVIGAVREPQRMSVCIDTCHLFAAGYNLRTADGYDQAIGELDDAFGLKRIACFHTNDSKTPCGSRVDRHEHIDKGRIGKAGFIRLVNDTRLTRIPRIIETDKGPDPHSVELDKKNLAVLRRMVGKRI